MTTETDAAIAEIAAERQRQVEVEGWTPEHDDRHNNGALARAGGCYAFWAGNAQAWPSGSYQAAPPPHSDPDADHYAWPWSLEWWKPKDPRRDLIRAGALIVAEIERLDRAAKAEGRHV